MTAEEADEFIRNYRTTLKSWTMAVAGFSDASGDQLYRELEDGQTILAEIALAHPEKSYSVDMLINSRSRTWAGWSIDRVPRPDDRKT